MSAPSPRPVERCPICDRPICKTDDDCTLQPDRCHYSPINVDDGIWCQNGDAKMLDDGEEGDCDAHAIDWRGRALAAEAALATLRAGRPA